MPVAKDAAPLVLLVDDEADVLELTKLTLASEGIRQVKTLQDSRKVMNFIEREQVGVVILDLMMPYLSGTELLVRIVDEHPGIPIIVMTASDDVETAVECLKNGAFDYLLKPVEPGRLVATVEKALRLNDLQREVVSLKDYLLTDRLTHADAFSRIITRSKKMRAIFQYAEVIAQTKQPVLITGETGVGKELMAHAIHKVSEVKGEFVPVNVAGLDDLMFSDTLFGHRKGAFTNAEKAREGLISRASHGTLFLDEIGDLSERSQVKLLRLLQGQEYYQLGSDILKSSTAQIVVATNQDLDELAAKGKFRKDLYYRLCSYHIHIPPLRERLEDLPLLLNRFIGEAATALNKPKPPYAADLPDHLATRSFPGNVRELKALVNDTVARHVSGVMSIKHFPKPGKGDLLPLTAANCSAAIDVEPLSALFGRFPTMEEIEDYMVERALALAAGRRVDAAALLGISRQALHKRLKATRES